jgi:hypothetical protein
MVTVDFYGNFFKTIKALVRFFIPPKSVPEKESLEAPVVYVGHHQNMRGPVFSLLWFPGQVRPWVLHVFLGFKRCYRHFIEFTFTKRKHMPKLLAALLAVPAAAIYSALLRSGGSIPVYRGSTQIRHTISQTMDALKKGQSIVIFPDVDYSNSSKDMGDIYTGFLQLERFYYRSQKAHLKFVPLAVDTEKKALIIGDPITFMDGESFMDGKLRVAQELTDSINLLSQSQPLTAEQ